MAKSPDEPEDILDEVLEPGVPLGIDLLYEEQEAALALVPCLDYTQEQAPGIPTSNALEILPGAEDVQAYFPPFVLGVATPVEDKELRWIERYPDDEDGPRVPGPDWVTALDDQEWELVRLGGQMLANGITLNIVYQLELAGTINDSAPGSAYRSVVRRLLDRLWLSVEASEPLTFRDGWSTWDGRTMPFTQTFVGKWHPENAYIQFLETLSEGDGPLASAKAIPVVPKHAMAFPLQWDEAVHSSFGTEVKLPVELKRALRDLGGALGGDRDLDEEPKDELWALPAGVGGTALVGGLLFGFNPYGLLVAAAVGSVVGAVAHAASEFSVEHAADYLIQAGKDKSLLHDSMADLAQALRQPIDPLWVDILDQALEGDLKFLSFVGASLEDWWLDLTNVASGDDSGVILADYVLDMNDASVQTLGAALVGDAAAEAATERAPYGQVFEAAEPMILMGPDWATYATTFDPQGVDPYASSFPYEEKSPPDDLAPSNELAAALWYEWWNAGAPARNAAKVFDTARLLLEQCMHLDDAILALGGLTAHESLAGVLARVVAVASGGTATVDVLGGVSPSSVFSLALRQLFTDDFLAYTLGFETRDGPGPGDAAVGARAPDFAVIDPNAQIYSCAYPFFPWMGTKSRRDNIAAALGEVVEYSIDIPLRGETPLRARAAFGPILNPLVQAGEPVVAPEQYGPVGRILEALLAGNATLDSVRAADIALAAVWLIDARQATLTHLKAKIEPKWETLSPVDQEPEREPPDRPTVDPGDEFP